MTFLINKTFKITSINQKYFIQTRRLVSKTMVLFFMKKGFAIKNICPHYFARLRNFGLVGLYSPGRKRIDSALRVRDQVITK